MTAYITYIDDSWSRGRVFTLGGYLATREVWEEMAPKWCAMLHSGPSKVSEFKTSDCRQKQGEFKLWGDKDKDRITRTAVDCVTSLPPPGLSGLAVSIAMPSGFESGYGRKISEDLAFRYCLLHYLGLVALFASAAFNANDSLEVVIDEKSGFRGVTDRVFRGICSAVGLEGATHRWAKSHADWPLQVADLIAYETAKEAGERLTEGGRPVSRALERLVGHGQHIASCCFLEDYKEHVMRGQQEAVNTILGLPCLYASGHEWRSSAQWPKRRWGYST